MTPAGRLGVLLAAATALGACTLTRGGSEAPSPSPTPAARFRLEIQEPVNRLYESAPNPVTSSCVTPASGPWSFLYTSMTPFIDITFSLYDGAASAAGSSNFRLDVSFGVAEGIPPYFIDPLEHKSGSHGSTGSVHLRAEGDRRVIEVMGSAAARDRGLQELVFRLECPTPSI